MKTDSPTEAIVPCGTVVSVLAVGPKVRGFKTGRGQWICKGDKNPWYNFLQSGNKAVSPVPVDLRHVRDPYRHESNI
jgi:hypothetical protein